jgi:ketosteroid isomerase-like protein
VDEGEPAAHPALAVLEDSRELLERVAEALLKLRKEPGLTERVLAPAAQAPLEQNRGTSATGKPYENEHCFVFELGGGKIRSSREYVDLEKVKIALSSARRGWPHVFKRSVVTVRVAS